MDDELLGSGLWEDHPALVSTSTISKSNKTENHKKNIDVTVSSSLPTHVSGLPEFQSEEDSISKRDKNSFSILGSASVNGNDSVFNTNVLDHSSEFDSSTTTAEVNRGMAPDITLPSGFSQQPAAIHLNSLPYYSSNSHNENPLLDSAFGTGEPFGFNEISYTNYDKTNETLYRHPIYDKSNSFHGNYQRHPSTTLEDKKQTLMSSLIESEIGPISPLSKGNSNGDTLSKALGSVSLEVKTGPLATLFDSSFSTNNQTKRMSSEEKNERTETNADPKTEKNNSAKPAMIKTSKPLPKKPSSLSQSVVVVRSGDNPESVPLDPLSILASEETVDRASAFGSPIDDIGPKSKLSKTDQYEHEDTNLKFHKFSSGDNSNMLPAIASLGDELQPHVLNATMPLKQDENNLETGSIQGSLHQFYFDNNLFFKVQIVDPTNVSDLVGSHTEYKILFATNAPWFGDKKEATVHRRYKDFLWIYHYLVEKYPGIIVPAIPEKHVLGRLQEEFIESRREAMEFFLKRVLKHEDLRQDDQLVVFLTLDSVLEEKRKEETRGFMDFLSEAIALPGLSPNPTKKSIDLEDEASLKKIFEGFMTNNGFY